MPPPQFHSAFAGAANGVRRALAARAALDGATGGAAAGAFVASGIAVFAPRMGASWLALAALVLGAGLGSVLAARRRWTDADVALFLDARLGSDEAITTALEQERAPGETASAIVEGACAALMRGGRRVRPAVFRRVHLALPLAVACGAVFPRWLEDRSSRSSELASTLTKARLAGLRRVEALSLLETPDADERKRLVALAEAAKKLEARAERGIDPKEALDALGRLEDGIDAERGRLADGKNRAGLEAAARALSRREETRAASGALARADVLALDRELERLANAEEARSREVAGEALDEALAAARSRGADDVARTLDEQRRLLEQRAAQSEALRELSRLLGGARNDDLSRRLSRLDRGDPDSTQALAEALAQALRDLDEADRQKIASALRDAAGAMTDGRAMTKEEMERLARQLSTPEGLKGLKDSIRKMLDGSASQGGSQARALAMAMLGLGEAQAALGGAPGSGAANPQSSSSGGPGPGGGRGRHGGETATVAGSSLPAQAHAPATGGIPIGNAPGRAPAMPGEAARIPVAGALEAAAPKELSAVERSNVPREYREQVGRYFAHE